MVSAITNVFGIGAGQPLATPLLDSAVWVSEAVLNASYEAVDFAFQHNGGINDSQGDQHPYEFTNNKNDISISPQELSSTFLIPLSAYRNNAGLFDQTLQNLAKILLEAHLVYGGLGTKAFKDSPIKGALFLAKDAPAYKDVTGLVLGAKTILENTGNKILNFDTVATPWASLDELGQGVTVLPYGKMIPDCVKMDSKLPQDFVISTGSNILTGNKEPQINVKYLLDKNIAEVAVSWFVAGVPSGMDTAIKGTGVTTP